MPILSDVAFELRLHKILYLLDQFENPKEIRILDFGCGAKRMANALTAKGYKVETLDNDSSYNPTYCVDGANTGLPDNSFDLIYAFEVLEHGWFEKEISRILKPGGNLLFTIPNPDMEWLLDWFIRAGLVKGKHTPHVNLVYPSDHETENLKINDVDTYLFSMGFLGLMEKVK